MANQWFRMYSEFATDPKVQMLTETDQRRLVMLFCLRCNSDVTLQDEEVTFMLRISNEEWVNTKANFISKGFINDTNEILNWDKRQFISDSSAERVARHRAKMKQGCNVTVTPPEQIQNRTDTEQIKPSKGDASGFEEFWKFYPKKVGKEAARKSWIKAYPKLEIVIEALEWQKQSDQWRKSNGQFIPNPATYINQGRWLDEKPRTVLNQWLSDDPIEINVVYEESPLRIAS